MDLRIADYAPSPGGRYIKDGPLSGEWFRNEFLIPAFREASEKREQLRVVLDGTSGYGSSFLEETFGGLVRSRTFRSEEIRKRLSIVAETRLFAPYQVLAERYLAAAERQFAAA